MKENDVDTVLEAKAICLGGCITVIVMCILLLLVIMVLSFTNNNCGYECKDPGTVTCYKR